MKLLFVYNANNDVLSAAIDYAHKVFRPSTYRCELCMLTHHNFGERTSWKNFRKQAGVEMEFWYIHQFEKAFKESYDYPVILTEKAGKRKVLIGKETLQQLENVDELIDQLKEKTFRK